MSLPRYPEYKDSGVEWLGEVPAHWEVKRLKNLATIQNGSDYKHIQVYSEGYPLIGSGGEFARASEYLYEGESVLLGRKGTIDRPLYIDGAFWPVDTMFYTTIKLETCAKYLYYCALTIRFDLYSTSTALPSMTQADLSNIHFATPELEEQTAIAAFLDRETAKIDGLIAEQEKLIALLAEKRQATISHAVTKGLNPAAPMKDSGVAWLGEVPAHWQISRLKQIVEPGFSVSYGIVQPGEPLDDGVPFVQTTNMSKATFDLDQLQNTTAEIAGAYPRSKLSGGEVILGIRASIGAAYVVPKHLKGANLSRGVARIVCCSEISSEYLVNILRSQPTFSYWGLSKQGSTFNEVSIETVRELSFAVPSRKEQTAIATFLDTEISHLDALTAEATHGIALLKERRSALISAAVTGKIDVRQAMNR